MRYYTIISLLLISLGLTAQQVDRSSFFAESQFSRNPAMTGIWNNLNAYAIYQQDWIGFKNAPRSIRAGIQYPFSGLNMGLGAEVSQLESGPFKQTGVTLAYDYQIRLDYNQRLSIGIIADAKQYQYDGSQEVVNNPDDPSLFRESANSLHFNTGLGIYYISADNDDWDENHFFAGLSFFQAIPSDLFFKNTDGITNLPRTLHGFALAGYRFTNRDAFFQPSIQIDYASENVFLGRVNLLFELRDAFWTGLSLGSNFSAAIQAGGIISLGRYNALRIGGMGDFNISPSGKALGMSYAAFVGYEYWL